jgi:hypothetical protein
MTPSVRMTCRNDVCLTNYFLLTTPVRLLLVHDCVWLNWLTLPVRMLSPVQRLSTTMLSPGLVWPPFIASGEPNRNHRLQGFHYRCSFVLCVGNACQLRGNHVLASRCPAMEVYSDFSIPAFSRHVTMYGVIDFSLQECDFFMFSKYVHVLSTSFWWTWRKSEVSKIKLNQEIHIAYNVF